MNKAALKTTLSVIIFGMFAGCSDTAEVPKANTKSDVAKVAKHSETKSHEADEDHVHEEKTSEKNSAPAKRSADSHTHGDAELAIVLEGDVVTVELESPLYNLVGFEHHPETADQKAKVKSTEEQLQKGEALFVFNAEAKCKLTSDSVSVELFGEDHDEDNHDDHEDDDHDETHKDALLQYQFSCANATSLSNVSVNLFEFFEEMSDVDVTYLGPSTQKQVSMTRSNTEMKLSR